MRRLAVLSILLIAACGGGGGSGDDDDDAPDAATGPGAEVVFDEARVATYALTIAPADWAQLNATARDEQYVPATLTYDGEVLADIGVRYKGGFGTLALCFDGQGNRTCPKLSMKLKFDAYVAGQRFYGLKRLNFHAMMYDPSHVKDRLAYGLFRAAGVPAPRAVHARITVNGELLGLFALVEEIDGVFTKDRFAAIDGGDGNLYKEVWPQGTDPAPYAAALDTNEGASVDRIVRFAGALTAAGDAAFRATLAQWTDVDALMNYLAVDRFIDHWDGIVGWYCDGAGNCVNHNFFWYEQADADRLWLLPWDMDNTFQVPSPIRESYGMPDWNGSSSCASIPVFFGIPGRAPACDPLIRRLGTLTWPEYQAATAALLAGAAAPGVLEARLDELAAQLAPHVAEDPAGPGTAAWQAALDELRTELPTLRARRALSSSRREPPAADRRAPARPRRYASSASRSSRVSAPARSASPSAASASARLLACSTRMRSSTVSRATRR